MRREVSRGYVGSICHIRPGSDGACRDTDAVASVNIDGAPVPSRSHTHGP